jgi:hypothetical protein
LTRSQAEKVQAHVVVEPDADGTTPVILDRQWDRMIGQEAARLLGPVLKALKDLPNAFHLRRARAKDSASHVARETSQMNYALIKHY